MKAAGFLASQHSLNVTLAELFAGGCHPTSANGRKETPRSLKRGAIDSAYLCLPYPGAAAQPYTHSRCQPWKCISPLNSNRNWSTPQPSRSRNPDELVQDVVSRHFEEETRSVGAVERGQEALQQGEYLIREQRSNP